MALDYMQMLLDLMEERQKCAGKRDEAIREISRLSDVIRATMNMIPPEQLARYEPVFERIEQRPPGLSLAIRVSFTAAATAGSLVETAKGTEAGKPETGAAGKAWLTPVEIRDKLKNMGFPFENYKANPLASIHTTLKRMVPGEMEVKTLKNGQKVYRLKGAGEWAQAFAEAREWLRDTFTWHMSGATVVGRKKPRPEEPDKKDPKQHPREGTKHGPSGSA